MAQVPKPAEYVDSIGTMEKGMNQGQAPTLLKNNQLANATNVTVRGDYVNNRPPIVQIPLSFSDPTVQTLLSGYYQGGCFYQPDFGNSSLMAAIAGRLLQFQISGSAATVSDQSIPGNYNTAAPTQSWLWQSENYVIVNDGQNLPLFFNGGSTVRSNGPAVTYGDPADNAGSSLTTNFVVPAVGQSVSITLNAPGYTGPLGGNILIDDTLYQASNAAGYSVVLTNLSDVAGNVIPAASQVLSEPSVWGVTAVAHTVPPGTYQANSAVATFTLTLATAKLGDIVAFAGQAFKVTNVSGKNATISTQNFQFINGGNLVIPAGTLIYFAANGQPNVTVTSTTAPFTVPAIGQSVTVASGQYTGPSNATVYIGNGQYQITAGPAVANGGTTLTVINIDDNPGTGGTANVRGPNGALTAQTLVGPGVVTSLPQLPAGRMGVYDLGRNWMALTDGRSYIASDIVGGSSGTPQLNFRDAVLNITENTFLFEGGVFQVPGSGQQITAMNFAATLDASLGQGPVQIGTQTKFFSNNAPVDRTTWESITNPIQTESQISNGPLGQYSTVLVNGDIWYRAVDGFRSLILGRRQFDTWGNVPQSREVQTILNSDNLALLNWGSAVVFDNRVLMTANPTADSLGVYHPVTIALNNDPLSGLNVKQPSVYDGIWTGGGANANLNVLQWITGSFNGVQRCFAFCSNFSTNTIELWEILSDAVQTASGIVNDNNVAPIVMDFETASLFDHEVKPPQDFCRLKDGELQVDQVQGPCSFQVFYKPDQYAQWVQWYAWSVDGTSNQYPRMGLGEPSGTVYDPKTNRPLRNGYTFQIRMVITGPCRLLNARFKAVPEPQPDFAPQLQSISFTANPNAP